MSQPSNQSIQIFRTVRAYRQDLRHESVDAIINRLRPLVMSVPGEEKLTGVLTRDTTVADFSPYMGEARHDAGRGFPIVHGVLPTVSYTTAQENLPGVDFSFQIGRDRFLANSAGNESNDLHQDLRDLS